MSEQAPNGTHDEPLIVEVKRETPALTAGQMVKLILLANMITMIIPISLFLWGEKRDTDNRFQQNQQLIFEVCVEAESRDAVYEETFTAVRAFTTVFGSLLSLLTAEGDDNSTAPSLRVVLEELEQATNSLDTALVDGIAALEPEDEKDCTPPEGGSP